MIFEDDFIPADIISAFLTKHVKDAAKDDSLSEDVKFGLCLYTDGGGSIEGSDYFGGWGVHGYLYADTPSKTGLGIKGYLPTDLGYQVSTELSKTHELYVMGERETLGVQANPHVTVLAYINGRGSLENATNNVGEGTAVQRAMEIIGRVNKQVKISKSHIVGDSRYALLTLRAIKQYEAKGWRKSDGDPLSNLQMWKDVGEVYATCIPPEMDFKLEWTKGHEENFGNIQADRLATQGLNGSRNRHTLETITVSPMKGHWANTDLVKDFNPLLVEMNWYIHSGYADRKTEDGLDIIYSGKHETPETWGQPNSLDTHSVCFVNGLPTGMENARKMLDKLRGEINGFEYEGVFFGDFSIYTNPAIHDDLTCADGEYIRIDRKRDRLVAYNKKPILTKLHPQRLSLNFIATDYKALEETLIRFKEDKLRPNERLTDITDLIFKETTKGKKTENVCIMENKPSMKIPVDVNVLKDGNSVYESVSVPVTITHGITGPRRRVFTGIKDYEPKVYVLTMFSYNEFRTFVVVKTNRNEFGIWTNVFANRFGFNITKP